MREGLEEHRTKKRDKMDKEKMCQFHSRDFNINAEQTVVKYSVSEGQIFNRRDTDNMNL